MLHLQRREVLIGLASVTLAQAVFGRTGAVLAADKIKPTASSALIVVDVQNCFLPGGSLAVKEGDQIIPVINRIAKGFENVVMTQDWHTPHHVSFASTHEGKKPFEVIKLAYGNQVLWPDHCVQGTEGAQIAKDISIPQAALVIRKGYHNEVDSYSAFLEADRKRTPAWAAISRSAGSIRCSSPASRPTSVSPGPRSTRVTPASPPMSWKTRAAASTSVARWPRPGPT
jgi:nicotinamidase/pyrazinamidase